MQLTPIKNEANAVVEAIPKVRSKNKPRTKSKVIPRKVFLQYEGKEITEDALIERFQFEWCKEYKIAEVKDLKIYYKIEDKKAYFVINGSVTIIIDFE